jgi:hypothetical protein
MMGRYRVLIGRHISHKDPSGADVVVGPGCPAGDIVETDSDLLKLNGKGGMQPKFERLPDAPAGETARVVESIAPAADPLGDMSDEELAKVAAEEEIDISQCADRNEVIAKIRGAKE